MPSPQIELDNLRALKLPRARERVLRAYGDEKLRSLLHNLIEDQERNQSHELLLWALHAAVDPDAPAAAGHDSIEAEFDDFRDAPLQEHREAFLNSFNNEDLHQLCMYAVSRLSLEALRTLLLRLLAKTEAASSRLATNFTSPNDPHSTTSSPTETKEQKRTMAFLEFDNDERATTHSDSPNTTIAVSVKQPRASHRAPRPEQASQLSRNSVRRSSETERESFLMHDTTEQALSTSTAPTLKRKNTQASKHEGSYRSRRSNARRSKKKKIAAPIDWIIHIPDSEVSASRCVAFQELPRLSRSQLQQSFNDAYLRKGDTIREAEYEVYVRPSLRAKHATRKMCLNVFAWAAAHRSLFTFKVSSGNMERACDGCIRAHRPCVRVVEHGTEHMMCFFPLPETLREGATLNELEFWVVKA